MPGSASDITVENDSTMPSLLFLISVLSQLLDILTEGTICDSGEASGWDRGGLC